MGTINREITVYNCDAEGCTAVKPVIDGDNYPESFTTGTVDLTSDPAGRRAQWVACKVAHIGKAVTAVKASLSSDKTEAEPEDAKAETDGHDDEEPPVYNNAAPQSGEYV